MNNTNGIKVIHLTEARSCSCGKTWMDMVGKTCPQCGERRGTNAPAAAAGEEQWPGQVTR